MPGSEQVSEILIQRRDDSVDTIKCEGANAYAGMVSHFEGVVAGSHPPIFGRTESLRLAAILDRLHHLTNGTT